MINQIVPMNHAIDPTPMIAIAVAPESVVPVSVPKPKAQRGSRPRFAKERRVFLGATVDVDTDAQINDWAGSMSIGLTLDQVVGHAKATGFAPVKRGR